MAIFSKVEEEKQNIYYFTSKDLDWKVLKAIITNTSLKFEEVNLIEFTYIILDKINNAYKIGKTGKDPYTRLSTLKTGNPNIDLKLVFPFQQFCEKDLHLQ